MWITIFALTFATALLGGTAAAWPIYFAPQRPDCLAGHVGFEPANPSASYLIGFRDNFAGDRRKAGEETRRVRAALQIRKPTSLARTPEIPRKQRLHEEF